MANELQVIIEQSGLEKTKAQVLLDNFSDYFKIAAEWEVKAKSLIVTSADQKADMDMARVGRLFLREKRIAIEKKRKELKEESLRESKAIDGISNVLKAVIVPIEEYLEQQEKFVEIQEEKKREQMRLEIEKRIEDERIENERLDVVERSRTLQAMEYRSFWSTDKYAFREMSQKNFESVMDDLKQRKSDYDKEQSKIREENLRLEKEAKIREAKAKKEREDHEKEMAEERKKREQELKEVEEKALAEKRKQADLIAKEKAKQEKLKKEAEEKEEKSKKEKEHLEKLLRDQIECPFCHKKFNLER